VNDHDQDGEISRHERLIYARGQVMETVRRVWVYIFIGVGIGAVVHNWVPEGMISSVSLIQDRRLSKFLERGRVALIFAPLEVRVVFHQRSNRWETNSKLVS
jgi:hypothetical protein